MFMNIVIGNKFTFEQRVHCRRALYHVNHTLIGHASILHNETLLIMSTKKYNLIYLKKNKMIHMTDTLIKMKMVFRVPV